MITSYDHAKGWLSEISDFIESQQAEINDLTSTVEGLKEDLEDRDDQLSDLKDQIRNLESNY